LTFSCFVFTDRAEQLKCASEQQATHYKTRKCIQQRKKREKKRKKMIDKQKNIFFSFFFFFLVSSATTTTTTTATTKDQPMLEVYLSGTEGGFRVSPEKAKEEKEIFMIKKKKSKKNNFFFPFVFSVPASATSVYFSTPALPTSSQLQHCQRMERMWRVTERAQAQRESSLGEGYGV
jgi:hypothetical protein